MYCWFLFFPSRKRGVILRLPIRGVEDAAPYNEPGPSVGGRGRTPHLRTQQEHFAFPAAYHTLFPYMNTSHLIMPL